MKIEFGIDCGEFSLAVSGNGLVLPGAKNQPFKKSLFCIPDLNDAAGLYSVKVEHAQRLIFSIPAHVIWVTHDSQPQPFIGLRPELETVEDFRSRFKEVIGKAVRITFCPITAGANSGKN